MFRQGDVLLIPVSKVPSGTQPVDRDAGRVVLAYGEVTGHAHAILEPSAQLVAKTGTDERFLRLVNGATLVHEEHAPITLPAGNYRVVKQREYTPAGLRNVAD